MKYRLFPLFTILLFFFSCSNDPINEENIIIEGKNLSSVIHIFYNYVYPDLPATRTFTHNYTFDNNKITEISSSIFHYFHNDTSRNWTHTYESIFFYDSNNNLVKVKKTYYKEDILTNEFIYTFDYDQVNRIKTLTIINEGDVTSVKHNFTYKQNTIEEEIEENYSGIVIIRKTVFYLDDQERVYRQTYKGPIYEYTNENDLTETSQEAIFNEGNLYQLLFNDSPNEEYAYSDIKVPSDFPSFNMPNHGYIPYHILVAPFEKIVESYNTNYISNIIPLHPTNTISTVFNYTFSKDNYPLRLETIYSDNRIATETRYIYK